jgi:hypothetical protein
VDNPVDKLGVIRVRTRETLCRPEVSQLILRGARACGFPEPAMILGELVRNPGDPRTGIFTGWACEAPRVVAVGFLPASAFWLAPTVALAYSEVRSREGARIETTTRATWPRPSERVSSRKLVHLVGSNLREWFKREGYDHVILGNLQHTDRSYIRGLAHFGRPSVIGSAIRFDW